MNEKDLTPQEMIMDANLREFGHRISSICQLEAGGKLTPEEAFGRIKRHWKQLKHSRRNLLKDDPEQTD